MELTRKIDEDYPFEMDESGLPYLPDNLVKEGHLYVLPNGNYLPRGAYAVKDGSTLIYEPSELSPFADMLAKFAE